VSQSIQKRLEALENKERQYNIKILNLPSNPVENQVQLHYKVVEIMKHVNPAMSSECVLEARRLFGARGKVGQGQGSSSSAENTSQRSPPVLVKLSSSTMVQEILKQGNKKLKSYSMPGIRIVDDVSKATQDKRATLIPRMKELRAAGLFAFIPFGPVAKIVYKQGDEWKTIFPQ
jgi:hypothetical protein